MASPERMRKSQLRCEIFAIPPCAPVTNTIPHAMSTTTTVRTAVARLESTPSMPIFANTEVNAAKIADSNANRSHILFFIVSMSVRRVLLHPAANIPAETSLRVLPGSNIDKKVLVLKNNAYLCNPIRETVLWPSG